MRNRVSVKCKVKSVKLRSFLILLMGLVCLILPQAVHAATYYVDIDGVGEDDVLGTGDDVISDDANPGTANEPWQTLGRAYTWYSGAGTKVTEGDTVLFKDGDYGEFRETYPEGGVPIVRSNWVTYKAAPGHTPKFSNVYVSEQDYTPPTDDPGHGTSYLVFDGFNIKNGMHLKYTSYIQVKNCNVTREPLPYEGFYAPYWVGGAVAIRGTGAKHVTIEDCNVWGAYRGIEMSKEYWTVSRCKVHYIGEDGISTGGADHAIVQDCEIYDLNRYITGAGIYPLPTNGTMSIGDVVTQADTNAEGIVTNLEYNHVGVILTTDASVAIFKTASEGGGAITGPTGSIATVTKVDFSHSDCTQTDTSRGQHDLILRRNIMHPHAYCGIKIFTYGNGEGFVVEDNLIYDVTGLAIHFVGPHGLNMNNNTILDDVRFGLTGNTIVDSFYNNIITKLAVPVDSGGYYANIVNHGNNIFGEVSAGGPTYPFALNSTEAVSSNFNALFTNAAENDFTLASGSPAIDFGNPDYAPSTDILGNSRDAHPDAGCYEYGEASGDILGDITGDGEVSINDVQACVSIILFAETDPGMIERADISGETVGEPDEEVNIYDLQELVNMVLAS